MRIRDVAAIAAAVAAPLTWAGQAQAQYYGGEFATLQMINQLGNMPSDVACQKGTPPSANAVAATRQVAMNQMRGYWDALSSGGSPLGFFLIDKRVRWTSGATVLDKKTLGSIKDPFVAPGNTLVTEPAGYAFSGDGLSAIGQWQVRDAGGQVVGTYQASFNMTKQQPRISTLQLIGPQTWIDPVAQYCHKVGDVLGYRLKLAREAAAFAAPRLAAAQATESGARDHAEKAKAAAAAAPGDAGKQEAAHKADADLALAANSARAYQTMAEKSRGELEAAQAEQAALDAKREAWKAADAAKAAEAAVAKP